MATEMKAYLTLRCPVCPNQFFRSVGTTEVHLLKEHGGMHVPLAEWIGLPAIAYKGGHPIEPHA